MQNVLFINLGGIGDEIMFLPAIISFKKECPNAKITLALEKRSSAITELTELIDEMIFVDKTKLGMMKLLLKMRFGKFDTVISSGSNKLISLLLFLSGIKTRIGYDSGKLSRKLLTHAVELNKNQYAVNMYHSLVEPLTTVKTYLPSFNIEKAPVQENTVLVHPGVSRKSAEAGMIKTITAKEWAILIDKLVKLGKKVVLTGGKDDEATICEIKLYLGTQAYEEVQTKTLRDLARLISSAERFVCSDSAPLHIAVGMKARTFVFFGSTDYKKLIPESNLVTPILNDFECPLRPCLWEHRQTSCESLGCLNFELDKVSQLILG